MTKTPEWMIAQLMGFSASPLQGQRYRGMIQKPRWL